MSSQATGSTLNILNNQLESVRSGYQSTGIGCDLNTSAILNRLDVSLASSIKSYKVSYRPHEGFQYPEFLQHLDQFKEIFELIKHMNKVSNLNIKFNPDKSAAFEIYEMSAPDLKTDFKAKYPDADEQAVDRVIEYKGVPYQQIVVVDKKIVVDLSEYSLSKTFSDYVSALYVAVHNYCMTEQSFTEMLKNAKLTSATQFVVDFMVSKGAIMEDRFTVHENLRSIIKIVSGPSPPTNAELKVRINDPWYNENLHEDSADLKINALKYIGYKLRFQDVIKHKKANLEAANKFAADHATKDISEILDSNILCYTPGVDDVFQSVKTHVGIEVNRPKPGQPFFILLVRMIIDSLCNNKWNVKLASSIKGQKQLLSTEGKKMKQSKQIKLASAKKMLCCLPPDVVLYVIGLPVDKYKRMIDLVDKKNKEESSFNDSDPSEAEIKKEYDALKDFCNKLGLCYKRRITQYTKFQTTTEEANRAKKEDAIKQRRKQEYKPQPIPQNYSATYQQFKVDDLRQEPIDWSYKHIYLSAVFIKEFDITYTESFEDDLWNCTRNATGCNMSKFFQLVGFTDANAVKRRETLKMISRKFPAVFKFADSLTDAEFDALDMTSFESFQTSYKAKLQAVVLRNAQANRLNDSIDASIRDTVTNTMNRILDTSGIA